MRLIAVPLARIRPSAQPVTTFLAQSTKAEASQARPTSQVQNDKSSSSSSSSNKSSGTATVISASNHDATDPSTKTSAVKGKGPAEVTEEEKPPLAKRLLNKASDFWINLGREDQKSTFDWKRKTYNMGERLMDRIDYEEWALKGVDPALGPSLERRKERKEGQNSTNDVKEINHSQIAPKAALNVPLLFPSSMLNSNALLSSLQRMTASRQPHHQKRLIWCIVGMPATIPFILIPVIPNLPFFYLLWRAYSHWKALSSSKYLSELLKQGRIVPTPSQELDRILSTDAAPSSPLSSSQVRSTPLSNSSDHNSNHSEPIKEIDYEQYILLKPHTIKDLVKTFKLEHQLSIDLTRARQQTIKSIQQGQMDRLEREAAGEGADVDRKAKL